MKIFSRGPQVAQPAKPATAQAAAVPIAQAAPPAAQPTPAPAAPAPAAAPAAPDISAILEANVKEMSEKIARLASAVEGEHSDRASFESKLEQMEERMRKLSSLTEMISAQYNPFVGAAPLEREPMPAPEVGLAAPPTAIPAPPAPAAAEAPALQLALDDPFAATLPPAAPPAAPALAPAAPVLAEPEDLAPPPAATRGAPARAEPEEAQPFRLWSVGTSFESSMLMLSWANHLLRVSTSRDHFASLVEYYHNIGWIGDPARDQLLAYADGIRQTSLANAAETDWRTAPEVHEKSLLILEKLRAIAEAR